MARVLLAGLPLQLVCQLLVSENQVLKHTDSAVNQSPPGVESSTLRSGISTARLSGLPLQLVCDLLLTSNPVVVTKDDSSVSPTSQSPPTFLSGEYMKFPEYHTAYKIHEQLLTWNEARDRCNSEGARLAIVDSCEKIARIKSIDKSSTKRLHVGIHKFPGSDQWVRVDNGLPLEVVPWKSEGNHTENCAGISLNDDGLVDYECTVPKEYFVCEISLPKE